MRGGENQPACLMAMAGRWPTLQGRHRRIGRVGSLQRGNGTAKAEKGP